MSNLRLINETTATSTASVLATDIFSADFDIYKIVITDIDQTSSGGFINQLRFINSSGSIVTSSEYDNALLQLKAYGSFGEVRQTNQTKMDLLSTLTGGSEIAEGAVIYIFNPFSSSSYTFAICQAQHFYETAGGFGTKAIGVLTELSSITGINFIPSGNSYDSFKFKVYGLRVDT